jgi:hypothetical protein
VRGREGLVVAELSRETRGLMLSQQFAEDLSDLEICTVWIGSRLLDHKEETSVIVYQSTWYKIPEGLISKFMNYVNKGGEVI